MLNKRFNVKSSVASAARANPCRASWHDSINRCTTPVVCSTPSLIRVLVSLQNLRLNLSQLQTILNQEPTGTNGEELGVAQVGKGMILPSDWEGRISLIVTDFRDARPQYRRARLRR